MARVSRRAAAALPLRSARRRCAQAAADDDYADGFEVEVVLPEGGRIAARMAGRTERWTWSRPAPERDHGEDHPLVAAFRDPLTARLTTLARRFGTGTSIDVEEMISKEQQRKELLQERREEVMQRLKAEMARRKAIEEEQRERERLLAEQKEEDRRKREEQRRLRQADERRRHEEAMAARAEAGEDVDDAAPAEPVPEPEYGDLEAEQEAAAKAEQARRKAIMEERVRRRREVEQAELEARRRMLAESKAQGSAAVRAQDDWRSRKLDERAPEPAPAAEAEEEEEEEEEPARLMELQPVSPVRDDAAARDAPAAAAAEEPLSLREGMQRLLRQRQETEKEKQVRLRRRQLALEEEARHNLVPVQGTYVPEVLHELDVLLIEASGINAPLLGSVVEQPAPAQDFSAVPFRASRGIVLDLASIRESGTEVSPPRAATAFQRLAQREQPRGRSARMDRKQGPTSDAQVSSAMAGHLSVIRKYVMLRDAAGVEREMGTARQTMMAALAEQRKGRATRIREQTFGTYFLCCYNARSPQDARSVVQETKGFLFGSAVRVAQMRALCSGAPRPVSKAAVRACVEEAAAMFQEFEEECAATALDTRVQEFPDDLVKMTGIACAAMLVGYSHSGQPDRATELWERMRADGSKGSFPIVRTPRLYAAYIRGMLGVGRVPDAANAFRQLRQRYPSEDVLYMYQPLLRGYATSGNVSMAEETFSEYKKQAAEAGSALDERCFLHLLRVRLTEPVNNNQSPEELRRHRLRGAQSVLRRIWATPSVAPSERVWCEVLHILYGLMQSPQGGRKLTDTTRMCLRISDRVRDATLVTGAKAKTCSALAPTEGWYVCRLLMQMYVLARDFGRAQKLALLREEFVTKGRLGAYYGSLKHQSRFA